MTYPPAGGQRPLGGGSNSYPSAPWQPGSHGHYPPGPPPKNNNGVVIGVLAGMLAVTVVTLVLVIALDRDGGDAGPANTNSSGQDGLPDESQDSSDSGADTGTLKNLADGAVDFIEQQRESALLEVACSRSDAAQIADQLGKFHGPDTRASVRDIRQSGATAEAEIEVEMRGQTEIEIDTVIVEMEERDYWCLSRVN